MNTLIISHIPESDPPQFQVDRIAREDHKSSEPARVVSPFGFPVEGRPDSDLMQELRWYLEDFLEYPFPPNTDHAENVLGALEAWGKQAFNDLFNNGTARDFFHDATREGYENLRLQVMSDDATILQWPWEALLDPQAAYIAVTCQIERRLNTVHDPMPIPDDLPRDRVNILLVTARPYDNDVGYRSISRRLVEVMEEQDVPAHVHVLRPPTFASLRSHLSERPHFYHIIHFDGHGGYGASGMTGSDQHKMKSSEGVLVFENLKGEESPISAEQLSSLLRENAVPVMVLNACQSGMLDAGAKDPFASVAAALLKAGIRGVVAMAYSLYVSGAQEFLPEFYRALFKTGDLSIAVKAGRQKMEEQRKRVCARGRCELRDFVVPVIYQQEHYDLSFGDGPTSEAVEKVELPDGASDEENPYGFIGRDRELLKLERAIRKDTPAILIHGLGGVGKTTLARGFVRWLRDTGGMDGCLWLGFADIRSAEYVINAMGLPLFGQEFLTVDMKQRVESLTTVLKDNRFFIVWDNFEAAAGIPDTYVTENIVEEDRGLLLKFLEKIRGGKTKIIITSRSDEEWLDVQRLRVTIGGLVGEERWEFCDKILDGLGLRGERTDKDQVELMDLLNGHPLAMRVILPRLEKMTARQLIDALRSNMDALGANAESLYATIQFAVEQLDEELKPLLIPLGLHEGFAQADMMADITGQVEKELTKEKIDRFFQALAAAGLVRDMGHGVVYELHPALTGYLRSTLLKSITDEGHDKWSRAFVEVMASLADQLAPRELHEQRFAFHVHHANFHYAFAEAERLQMDTNQMALIQSLAVFAQNTRNFSEASELLEHFAILARKAGQGETEAAAYNQLGRIAREQRDFSGAEQWYMKSLTIREKQGDKHGVAITNGQLGIVSVLQEHFEEGGRRLIKSIMTFTRCGDSQGAEQGAKIFMGNYAKAPSDEQAKLKEMWEKAGLGPFPEVEESEA